MFIADFKIIEELKGMVKGIENPYNESRHKEIIDNLTRGLVGEVSMMSNAKELVELNVAVYEKLFEIIHGREVLLLPLPITSVNLESTGSKVVKRKFDDLSEGSSYDKIADVIFDHIYNIHPDTGNRTPSKGLRVTRAYLYTLIVDKVEEGYVTFTIRVNYK